ncbi:MAG TPA: F0F1 ATP synthase subunit A [Spirochaetia bacterium]|nr:F0F1 ATP synthase subunit A [Spirochaetia bacterium]
MTPEEAIYIPIRIGSFDLSITSVIVWIFAASAVLLLVLLLATRKLALVPVRPLQNIVEYTVEFVEKQIIEPAELESRTWTPFFLTLFLFILFNDLVGIIPGTHATTSNINETGALAVLIFLIGNFLRLKRKGPGGFVKSLIPEGVSGPLLILMFPIEVVSQLLKPFSLAIRLFANMTGDHLLLVTIISFVVLFQNIAVSIMSIGGAVVVILFEIFIDFIQAYIFAFLSAMLVNECLEVRHEE